MNAIERVLIAVDLSPRSHLVIDAVRRVVPDQGASLVLLHVVGDLETELSFYGRTPDRAAQLQRECEDAARQRLEVLRNETLPGRDDVVLEVRVGPHWSEIVASALKNRTDLVFLGAHFLDRDKSSALGDVVQRVTRLSPCPVVVVPTAETG